MDATLSGANSSQERRKSSHKRFNKRRHQEKITSYTSASFLDRLSLIKDTVIETWKKDRTSPRWARCCKTILGPRMNNLGHPEEEIISFQEIMEKNNIAAKENLVKWIAEECLLPIHPLALLPTINMHHRKAEEVQPEGEVREFLASSEAQQERGRSNSLNGESAGTLTNKNDELELELVRAREEIARGKEEIARVKEELTIEKAKNADLREDVSRMKNSREDQQEDYHLMKDMNDLYRSTYRDTVALLEGQNIRLGQENQNLIRSKISLVKEVAYLKHERKEQDVLLAKRNQELQDMMNNDLPKKKNFSREEMTSYLIQKQVERLHK
jgi:hypothetical protein